MSVKYEEVGSPEETGNQENKWAELEELGKQGFHPEKKERNIFQKVIQKIETKRAEKLLSKGDRRSDASAIRLIENGDVDLSSSDLADKYINAKLSYMEYRPGQDGHYVRKSMLEKIEDMEELEIPAEKPISIIADKTISKMNEAVNSEYSHAYSSQFDLKTVRSDADGELIEISEIIKKYNAIEVKDRIKENVDVQLFGDKVVKSIMEYYREDDNYPNREEQKKMAAEGIFFLKDLGYEPFKNNLDPLFQPKKYANQEERIAAQKLANELGLINAETVDRMYRFNIDSINTKLSGNPVKYSLPISIYEGLECSGKDKLALFVKEQETKTGGSFLADIFDSARDKSSFSITQEIIRKYGRKNIDPIINESMNFLLTNPDVVNGPDRGYLLCIKDLIDNDNDNGQDQLWNRIRRISSNLCHCRTEKQIMPDALFDENGISVNGKELAVFNADAREVVRRLKPDWKEGYPEEMKPIMKVFAMTPQTIVERGFLKEFSPERQSLIELKYKYPKLDLGDIEKRNIENYFNSDGSVKTEFVNYMYETHRTSLGEISEIKALLPKEKQAYVDTLAVINADENNALYKLTEEQIAKFFDAEGPKKELWGYLLKNGNLNEIQPFIEQEVFSYEDMGLTAAQKELIKYYNKLYKKTELTRMGPMGRSRRKESRANTYFDTMTILQNAAKNETVEDLFDEKGPTRELWTKLFEAGIFGMLSEEKKEGTELGLTENKEESLAIYDSLEESRMKETFKDFATQYCDNVPKERLKIAPDVLNRLHNSNSYEMGVSASKLAMQLLPLDPEDDSKLYERIEKIEDIFLRNNLPYVGKVFSTFRILHPPEQFDTGELSHVMRGVLKDLPNQGMRSREAVLWNDVLKATVGSNNRNLIEYLKNLEEEEHLEVLADNTTKAREAGENPEAFTPTKRYTRADRIIRSFAYSLGYETFEQFEKAVKEIPRQADIRNRKRLKNNDFSLGKGDLVKSTRIEFLGDILQNGAVSKEFLNGQADSDSTPLDSDCGMYEEDFGTISEAIDHKNSTNLFGAMHCIFVFKSDESTGMNRFQNEGEGSYDPTKYEIWKNSGENHGIRVGIPSSEIDFIVYDNLGKSDNQGDLNRIKFEIARNGFFIPIVDKNTGKPVFTEEEYENIRQKMRGLGQYGTGEYVSLPTEQLQIKSMEVEVEVESTSNVAEEATDENENKVQIQKVTIPSTAELIAGAKDNEKETDEKRNAIIDQVLKPVLAEYGFEFKPVIDGDITEGTAEVIDTGSTGRYSNAPKDGDFDFMMKLDLQFFRNSEKFNEFREKLLEKMGATTQEEKIKALANGNIRIKDVKLESLEEPVDIDVTFTHKTNKVQYSTDMALKEYYDAMPPEIRKQVVANVLFAKKYLKAKKIYKRHQSDEAQGGFGGVGVENWIIQNGGSFVAAAKEFMAVAEKCMTFEEFKSKYAIWDFGENHMIKGNVSHDNFVVQNMNATGYEKMKNALEEFLAQV